MHCTRREGSALPAKRLHSLSVIYSPNVVYYLSFPPVIPPKPKAFQEKAKQSHIRVLLEFYHVCQKLNAFKSLYTQVLGLAFPPLDHSNCQSCQDPDTVIST